MLHFTSLSGLVWIETTAAINAAAIKAHFTSLSGLVWIETCYQSTLTGLVQDFTSLSGLVWIETVSEFHNLEFAPVFHQPFGAGMD